MSTGVPKAFTPRNEGVVLARGPVSLWVTLELEWKDLTQMVVQTEGVEGNQ